VSGHAIGSLRDDQIELDHVRRAQPPALRETLIVRTADVKNIFAFK
jgi:hypothetical protein